MTMWWSTQGQIQRFQHIAQDAVTWLHAPPAHPDIVIVAIDTKSLNAIGRWPWRRALHAQLLDNISKQQPAAIGFDILFHDEDQNHPEDDALFSEAIARNGHVILPATLPHRQTTVQTGAWELPSEPYAATAAGLGHVHLESDLDGLLRRVHLYMGPPSSPLPHLALGLFCIGQIDSNLCQTPSAAYLPEMLLRPIAKASRFKQYSFIDVLHGDIPAEAFKNKYVLIGATASGLGQGFYAPNGWNSQPLPNVEAVAQVLNSLISGPPWHSASPPFNAMINFMAVASVLMAVSVLGPSATLLLCLVAPLLLLLLTALLPWFHPLLLSPAPVLLAMVLIYPLWSWLRLSEAANFLESEMKRLHQEGVPLTQINNIKGDRLEHKLMSIEHATRQLQELHQFVSESLRQLPLPTFITDLQGKIVLNNTAAQDYVFGAQSEQMMGSSVTWILKSLRNAETGQALLQPMHFKQRQLPDQHEAQDAQGRTLLVLCKPFNAGSHSGWMIALVDLTATRQAVIQRDQAMHFISHDIRAPIGSIVTLLEMQRNYPGQWTDEALHQRIERYARHSLTMAQDFTQLFSASQQNLQLSVLDLASLLEEVMDDLWVSAQESGIKLHRTTLTDSALCDGDRNLLRRAIGNILSNAIKYSPPGSNVECALWPSDASGSPKEDAGYWCLSVQDQGHGIPPVLQPRLFEPFARMHTDTLPDITGTGLGLAFTRTVMTRHHGGISLQDSSAAGSTFWLWLPQSYPKSSNSIEASKQPPLPGSSMLPPLI